MRVVLTFLLAITVAIVWNSVLGNDLQGQGQPFSSFRLEGQVVDAQTEEPLPFASIIVPNETIGSISDIDGLFEITSNRPIKIIEVSHVGYFTEIFNVELGQELIKVNLAKKPIDLAVAHIYPGQNPAHRVIINAKKNREANNPETSGPFSYRSYNKIVFSDNPPIWQTNNDLEDKNIKDSLPPDHYLLIVETVSDRFFESKTKDNEVVLTSRISGFSEPYLTFLATRHQSFSFYNNYVELSGTEYLSPLSTGSTNRYLFILENTSFDGKDSIFVISYRPLKGSGYNGLEGIININSNGWAIQSITAEPAGKKGKANSRIKQFYKKIDGKRWFPVQLDVDLEVFNLPIGPTLRITAKGRTYLSNIEIEPDFSKHEFSAYYIDLTKIAPTANDQFWNKHRAMPLSKKEELTYNTLGEIGQKRNLDGYFRFAETLLQGKVRAGFIDFYIDEFMGYTRLDGVRLGAGFVTNKLFPESLKLTGRFAHGLKSKQWRTGYSADVLLNKDLELWLGLTYSNKTKERGASFLLEEIDFFSLDKLRTLFIPHLDLVKSHELWTRFSLFSKQLQVKLYGRTEEILSIDHIFPYPINGYAETRQFNFFETGLMLRLAFGEKYVKTPTRAFVDKKGTPVAFLTISKGFNGNFKGNHDYLRAEARLDHSYRIRLGGVQSWVVQAGLANGTSVPWSKLFTAPTSPKGFWPGPSRAFATMSYNEFVSDKYLMVFFEHDFEKLLTGRSGFWPNISIVSNFGIGALSASNKEENVNLKSFEKGYFESGIALTDMLGTGLGVQLMYRYGPHSHSTFKENFSARLHVSMLF